MRPCLRRAFKRWFTLHGPRHLLKRTFLYYMNTCKCKCKYMCILLIIGLKSLNLSMREIDWAVFVGISWILLQCIRWFGHGNTVLFPIEIAVNWWIQHVQTHPQISVDHISHIPLNLFIYIHTYTPQLSPWYTQSQMRQMSWGTDAGPSHGRVRRVDTLDCKKRCTFCICQDKHILIVIKIYV